MKQTGENKGPVVAVDIGGTKILTAIVSQQGEIIARQSQPTLAKEGKKAVIERLVSGIDRILEQNSLVPTQLSAISLATAGNIDITNGLVAKSPHLPDWKDVPLRGIVAEKFKIPVFLLNDADAAALGEHRFGAGKGLNTVVLLTLGTGIGGGIIINGKLYTGVSGSAAEIGHMVVDTDGPECPCGSKGCLETLASGTAVAREAINSIKNGGKSALIEMVKGKVETITAEDVHLAAKERDSLSLEAIGKAAYYLGIGVINVVNILNPEMVIIGGGMSEMGDLLLEPVKRLVKERAFPLLAWDVRIVSAVLGNDAGIFGAAAYAAEQPGAGVEP